MDRQILVVDDEQMILDLYIKAFKKLECSVETALSAEKAMEILDNSTYPVIFLDLKLPGMNGVELCRKIRETNTDSMIYAVTGHTSIFEHASCLEAGFNDYFKKPIDVTLLKDTALEGLEKYQAKKI